MKSDSGLPIDFLIYGVLLGVWIGGSAVMLVLDGWGSPIYSALSVFGAPIALVAWDQRTTKAGAVWAGSALLIALVIDAIMLVGVLSEGLQHATEAVLRSNGMALLWAVPFVSWQALAIAAQVCIFRQSWRIDP